jgi:hypothetical protein
MGAGSQIEEMTSVTGLVVPMAGVAVLSVQITRQSLTVIHCHGLHWT